VNCYDCAVEGRAEPAIGTCINCSAGVCRRHMHVEEREVEHGSLGPRIEEATRRLVCTSCDQVLVNRESAKPQRQTSKKRSLADLADTAKSALGKQDAPAALRTRRGSDRQKSRQELYEEAQRRGVKGRSNMSRDELARALSRS
jgi:hypothetical protein